MSEASKAATISELVEASGKSRPTVYRLIASGELPGYRTSRGYIVPREWFERWQRGEWVMPQPTKETAEEAAPTPDENSSEPVDFLKRRKTA